MTYYCYRCYEVIMSLSYKREHESGKVSIKQCISLSFKYIVNPLSAKNNYSFFDYNCTNVSIFIHFKLVVKSSETQLQVDENLNR